MNEDVFFSIDCETSGPFPGRHALLSVGAVVVRCDRDTWRSAETYYREWAPPPEAEATIADSWSEPASRSIVTGAAMATARRPSGR